MNSLHHVMINLDVMVNMAEMKTMLLLHSRLMNSLLHMMINLDVMEPVLLLHDWHYVNLLLNSLLKLHSLLLLLLLLWLLLLHACGDACGE